MMRYSKAAIAVLVAMPTLVASSAQATEKKSDKKIICADAYEHAQTLRDGHHLLSAREQLAICSQPSCPGFIVKDCTAWFVEVDGRIPGLVLSAKDEHGQPLANVSVAIDGNWLTEKLDGQSIEVDPGEHRFTFTAGDGTTVEQSHVVFEGQKAQSLSVTIASTPPVIAPKATPDNAPWPGWTLQQKVALGTAAVGLVGIGLGTAFGLTTLAAVNDQKKDCATTKTCTNRTGAGEQHTRASTDGTLSDVGFIAGGAFIAAAAALYFVRIPLFEPKASSTAITIRPVVGASGGMLYLGRGF